ncbi:hypothetical protein KI387_043719 [Taxus chinensis]|uniref:Retrotransposon gag domain-containing protein n=1 Tax=Taxus chinensis TaxID=29808 RepID=A0AA38GZC7_TAXCH|nr:hypothetical protein KI387_043719 [Taxus chinensis]
MAVPWGNAMGPLALPHPVHALPHGNRKNFPKFDGSGNQSTDSHISAFIMSCSILDVTHEDVSVHLFLETLQGPAAEWFQHLPAASITSWATLREAFEDRYKPSEDAFALLSRITHLKKEANETIRDFVTRFNALINRVPTAMLPTPENQKCFFVNAMSSKVSFLLLQE